MDSIHNGRPLGTGWKVAGVLVGIIMAIVQVAAVYSMNQLTSLSEHHTEDMTALKAGCKTDAEYDAKARANHAALEGHPTIVERSRSIQKDLADINVKQSAQGLALGAQHELLIRIDEKLGRVINATP